MGWPQAVAFPVGALVTLVRWDGDRLMIETGQYSGPTRESGPYLEHEEVWALDTDGRLIMSVADRDPTTGPRTTQLAYRKP